MVTAINIKLADDRAFEQKMARVLISADLPHGYKKRFFVNLCRAIFSSDISDEQARERVIRVAEEGMSAVVAFDAAPPQPPAEPLASAHATTEASPQGVTSEALASTPGDAAELGRMFR